MSRRTLMLFPRLTPRQWLQCNILPPVVTCYILGSAAARYLLPAQTVPQSAGLLIIVMLIIVLMFRRQGFALSLILPVFALIGLIHTGSSLSPPDNPTRLRNLITAQSRVTVTGTLLRMPEYNGRKTSFELAVDTILFHSPSAGAAQHPVPAEGHIRLSLKDILGINIRPGDHLMVIATVNRTYNYRTPGSFDYRLHMADRSIYVTGWVHSRSEIIAFQKPGEPWTHRARFLPERLRQDIAAFLDHHLDPKAAGLYKALLIGSRAGINSKTLEQYKATGCMHLLAISGLHMGLLGLMITMSFMWLMKRSNALILRWHVPTVATLLSLPFLVGYAFIAGLNTPVIRAMIMAILFLFAVVLRRQRSLVHVVAAAALILLWFRPLALFTVSFQLSFTAVLAITFIYPNLLALFNRKDKIDKEKISRLTKLFQYVKGAFMVSTAATLGSLPFMLYHFNRFSPVGPLANLLVEPMLCFWALPIGLAAVPLIFLSPDLAALMIKAGALGITAADKITLLGSRIPFSSCWTITPNPIEIIVFYVILCLWLVRSKIKGAPIIIPSLCLILLLSFMSGLWHHHSGSTTEVFQLDVGQGSSTFIQLPRGSTILLDGGSTTSPQFDIGERVIAPFLWKKRIWRLDELVISHPHYDHYNGLPFILRHFGPKRLWINDSRKAPWRYRRLLKTASRRGTQIIAAGSGQKIASDSQAELFCLGMKNTGDHKQARKSMPQALSINDQSIVLKLRHGDFSFLFPGDIGTTGEKKLINNLPDLRANLLLAPHHGSRTSGSRSFINAVNPEFIVVSAGHSKRDRYPDPAHLKQWLRDGRTILETADMGTVTCITDGTRLEIKTWRNNIAP